MERNEKLSDHGYRIVEIYSCEWEHLQTVDEKLRSFLKEREVYAHNRALSEKQILAAIQEEKLFGVVQCDVKVPSHLEHLFEDFPPVFKHATIQDEHIGEHMRDFLRSKDIAWKDRRSLISCMSAKQIPLITPVLKWYLDKGIQVGNISQVIQYKPVKCFQNFVDAVSNARRQGDEDEKFKARADSFKLAGNSAFGKTIANQERHTKVQFAQGKDVEKMVRLSRFLNLTPVNSEEDVWEVNLNKKKIVISEAIQIGFFVLQYAKLLMNQFYFDFIAYFFRKEDYMLCYCDTDSIYMAISEDSLDDCVPRVLSEEYKSCKRRWFPREECLAYDKRQPGLLKIEYEGTAMIALTPKSYYVESDSPSIKSKQSHKGVSHKLNHYSKKEYLSVIESGKTVSGTNRGFRTYPLGENVHTYEMTRDALSYIYGKREVLNDGISTRTLKNI